MSAHQIARLPIPTAAHAQLPVGSVDVLPSQAAARWPNRTALRGSSGQLTFAELDRKISRLAAGIRELIDGGGSVVAVSASLGLDFPIAYYAVVRSGNVVAPINPRLGADVLERLLVALDARVAILAKPMYDRVRPVLARSANLEHTVVFSGPGPLTCDELAARRDLLVEPRDRDETDLAAIMFGSGRAGHARTAGQSHHTLKLEAGRISEAHGLSEDAIALNALPAYHQAHLNGAMLVGATQVFCGSPDPSVLASEARRHNASHCYGMALGHPDYLVLDRRSWPAVLPRRAVAS
jgi:long-chain acyl-CoA synthetase